MRVLITGANGMLGRDLQAALAGHEVTALARADLDVTDAAAVAAAVHGHDAVVNCAAYTKVDDAETHEDLAYAVNATGPANLAAACAATGARLVTVSTDYVFDGDATEPYAEDLPRDPINAYGRTKAAGEELALAANFARTMLNLAKTKDAWSVVDDQLGQPTWTADLASQIVALLDAGAPAGIYHGTNSGQATWYEFARAVLEESGLDPERLTPTDSATFVRPAPRPSYSVLGHDAWAIAGIPEMRPWREALADAVRRGVFAG
jgi:dTDP-4-dehydrorhamnose reductase